VSKLPNLERDFAQSNAKVKGRLGRGVTIRSGFKGINYFRPRFAPFFATARTPGISGEDFEEMMDTDPVYDSNAALMDEGETDDSVGYYRGSQQFSVGKFMPFAGLLKTQMQQQPKRFVKRVAPPVSSPWFNMFNFGSRGAWGR
jgi:hypothetical protein